MRCAYEPRPLGLSTSAFIRSAICRGAELQIRGFELQLKHPLDAIGDLSTSKAHHHSCPHRTTPNHRQQNLANVPSGAVCLLQGLRVGWSREGCTDV